jgi:hypothetical protein
LRRRLLRRLAALLLKLLLLLHVVDDREPEPERAERVVLGAGGRARAQRHSGRHDAGNQNSHPHSTLPRTIAVNTPSPMN